MSFPFVHRRSTDAGALRTFCADLFDWKINADNPMDYGMVDANDNESVAAAGGVETSGIGGGIGQMPDGHPGDATFSVDVDDVEAALQRAEALGGTRVMGAENVMEGLIIGMFTDPEGHLVGLAASG